MSIQVLLVRHAKPLALDTSQKLSPSGKEMQKVVNAYLKNELGLKATHIWTSPILRALETAQMIGETFGIVPEQEVALSELEASSELEITRKLQEVPDKACVILVTHSPQIVRLTSLWAPDAAPIATPPTSSALLLEFAGSVQPGGARFIRLVTHSDLISGHLPK